MRTRWRLGACVLLGALALSCSSDGEGDGASGSSGSGGSSGNGGNGGSGGSAAGLPTVGGCGVFTAEDDWNRDVSAAPVDAASTQKLQNLVGGALLHPDYGGDGAYGIPINVVPESQAAVPISFDWYPDESDAGPYPFPDPGEIAIEGGSPTSCDGDCHVLVVQQGTCMLYEGYACEHPGDGWHCGGGAKWDLGKTSTGQRPEGWTSADAAGLAILPGLLRYDEVMAGAVRHAIRFTVHCTAASYVPPATHFAVPGGCEGDPNAPPMGLRVRLRADFDISGFPATAQVILTAMKQYGMILADNGSDFFFQGEAHPDWTDDAISPLKDVPASAFEVVTP